MEKYIKIKRKIDIVLAIALLILLLPIFLVISTIIKIGSKGPIFFAHRRIGKNGKLIKVYKFRTMVPNAEELIKNFNEEQMREYKDGFKLKNDPRVTKVGKILRKTSLDELPQLVNVIQGDLSLIGPRPIVEEELEKYGNKKQKLLSITPGITGYWAAYNNPNTTYAERIEMELYYVDNISLRLDFNIFLKTIRKVISRSLGGQG